MRCEFKKVVLDQKSKRNGASYKGICFGDVLKISDVDTEMFINAVIDHNHTWNHGIHLEFYKQNNPGMSKGKQKRYTYYTSFPCDIFHTKRALD